MGTGVVVDQDEDQFRREDGRFFVVELVLAALERLDSSTSLRLFAAVL